MSRWTDDSHTVQTGSAVISEKWIVSRYVKGTLAIALLASSTAFADTATDLSVKGSISPVSCEITMGKDVDLGKISQTAFQPGKDLELKPTFTTFSVTCPSGPARFRLKAVDNAASS